MNKPIFDIERVEKALQEAAQKARFGTRDEQSGKFLGKQTAVEDAVASLHRKQGATER